MTTKGYKQTDEQKKNEREAHLKRLQRRDDYYLQLSKEAIDFFNGSMLGDGSIDDKFISQASKYREYAEYISETLMSFGIQPRAMYHETYTRKDNGFSEYYKDKKFDDKLFHTSWYTSKSYNVIKEVHDRWYLDGFHFCFHCEIIFHDESVNRKEWEKGVTCPVCEEHRIFTKVVPEDIELTPITCMQWYLDDGCKNHGIMMCTGAFLQKDIEMLRDKLKSLGFESKIDSNRSLQLDATNARRFLQYIGECPVECFKYKWKLPHRTEPYVSDNPRIRSHVIRLLQQHYNCSLEELSDKKGLFPRTKHQIDLMIKEQNNYIDE